MIASERATLSPVYFATLGVVALIAGLNFASGGSTQDILPVVLPLLALGLAVGLGHDLVGFGCLAVAWLPFSRGFANYELGVVTLDVYMLAVLTLAAMCALLILFGRARFKPTSVDLTIGFICIVYLSSTLLSADPMESGYLAVHSIFIPVLTYFSMKTLANSELAARRLVRAFVVGAMLFALFVIKDYLLIKLRVETFRVPPISIGTVIFAALVLCLTSGAFGRWLRWILAAVLLGGLFATLTRVFILLAVLAPGIYWCMRRGLGTPALLTMLSLSLLATVMLAASGNTFRPSGTYDASAGNVTEGRLTNVNAWKEALYSRALDDREGLASFRANPVVGTGLHRGLFVTRHNIHVAWLEYGGLLGYFAYIWLFVSHFMRCRRLAKSSMLISGTLLAMFAILTNGITNGFMHGFMPIVVFMVLGMGEGLLCSGPITAIESIGSKRRSTAIRPGNLMA